jgi:hypothetical protein
LNDHLAQHASRRLRRTRWLFPALSFFLLIAFSGCHSASYPEEQIESSIQEICVKEYGVEGVEVKIVGKTIGVFLPLKKLFTTDVKHLVMSGQVENLETLFEPEPDAMDKLEDVLFTISRVMLSTDKEIDFYVLKAADVKATGLQLVLTGYIPDVRRVRLWDIPRSEYRKRVFHELKLNRTILWEEPVRGLFDNIGQVSVDELEQRYFSYPIAPDTASPFFFDFLNKLADKESVEIDVLETRSYPYANLQALLYVKLIEHYELKPGVSSTSVRYPSGQEFEYIFVVRPGEKEYKIAQVIPFHYIDDTNQLQKTNFPPELGLYQNLDTWSERFEVQEVFLGEFLAKQLNRRLQAMLIADERVRLTIKQARLNFVFLGAQEQEDEWTEAPHFVLFYNFTSKTMKKAATSAEQMLEDEDIQHVLNQVLKEFARVTYSYGFKDYDGIDLAWEGGSAMTGLKIEKSDIELFRRKKLKIADLLQTVST